MRLAERRTVTAHRCPTCGCLVRWAALFCWDCGVARLAAGQSMLVRHEDDPRTKVPISNPPCGSLGSPISPEAA